MQQTKILYLVKANDDVISHCECESALVGSPAQVDCPWCGCGWLFVCHKCRKAFTFARAQHVDGTWEELARADWTGKWKNEPTDEDVKEWVGFMKMMLKDIKPGKTYVYLDSWVLPIDQGSVAIKGIHARHDLSALPHVEALKNSRIIEEILSNRDYWRNREIREE